ncbi:SMC family ATPase [Nitrosopumilus sp.]|nr:SMC family ATPase [Nitrosopumilus sp.]
MITSIELVDFLSHSDTKLKFEEGVTIFVGDNGAGKSSIIDAITFSLFGQHTRKSNKGLIRRGTNQGYAKIEFSIKDKQYETVRKIDTKGSLSAIFSETTNNNRVEIAAGERKQFGESMTEQVEKTIGMNFEKLKIASIVQQGELNAIINAKPKEFKELLNAIIGIDKLDIASESMKKVTKEFREKIRTDLGYDDTHIDILTKDFEKNQYEIKEAEPEKNQLELQKKEIHKELEELQKKEEIETPKRDKINQLELQKKELLRYVKETIQGIQQEIQENERKIDDCKNCFEELKLKTDFERKLEKVEEEDKEVIKKIQEITTQIVSLKEKEKLAEKLQLKDNKCPVCDSIVEKLNPFFQEKHIKEEIIKLKQGVDLKEKERIMYSQERDRFAGELQKIRDAEATLRAHSIKTKEELVAIKNNTEIKKGKLSLANNENLEEISQIDDHTKLIFSNILKLELETKGFDEGEIEGEIIKLKQGVDLKEKERIMYSQERDRFAGELQKIRDAEATLRAHSIKTKEELVAIKNNTEIKKGKLSLANNENLEEISQIDDHTKLIFSNILKLELETKGFDEGEFKNLKERIVEKRGSLSRIDQQMGGVLEKIEKAKKQSEVIEKSILELEKVKKYMSRLDKIQSSVFSRDGSVATSLRSWALNSISIKASDYLSILNTKIQRIALSEKARDVSIACHSKTEVLELESLSGGEKVSVALALRLGMASLLGASNLNLMILDEPTTHLDTERKKSLVDVLSQLSRIEKSQLPMQFLIITHDAEIFENSNVEQIYKFESREEGSKVTAL